MNKVKNIIILYGGLSDERVVSMSSAKEIKTCLLSKYYNVLAINLSGDYSDYIGACSFDELLKMFQENMQNEFTVIDSGNEIGKGVIEICRLSDIVFLGTHGGIGENGKLQALLDIENIVYTGNSFLSTAVSMNKTITKKIVQTIGYKVPEQYYWTENDSIEYPVVVKPLENGSSIGVRIVENSNQLREYLNEFGFGFENILIEQYVSGREFSVGVVGEKAFPVIEIVVKDGFYDYNKKYTPGAVEEIVPAVISKQLSDDLKKAAVHIHKELGLDIYSRTDFIVDSNQEIYFIETNSLPGMTPTSLLPQEAKAIGIDCGQLCELIIYFRSYLI